MSTNLPQAATQFLRALSDEAIIAHYNVIADAVRSEGSVPQEQQPYGLRNLPELRAFVSLLVAELRRRGLPFRRIDW